MEACKGTCILYANLMISNINVLPDQKSKLNNLQWPDRMERNIRDCVLVAVIYETPTLKLAQTFLWWGTLASMLRYTVKNEFWSKVHYTICSSAQTKYHLETTQKSALYRQVNGNGWANTSPIQSEPLNVFYGIFHCNHFSLHSKVIDWIKIHCTESDAIDLEIIPLLQSDLYLAGRLSVYVRTVLAWWGSNELMN